MKQSELFKRLGYPKHAAAIYDLLIKTRTALSITQISQETQLPRMTIYRCLEALQRDKLTDEVQVGKRTQYTGTNPQALAKKVQLVEEQSLSVVDRSLSTYEKDIPGSMRFLYGPAGIKAAFDDVINHCGRGETFFRYTSEQDLAKVNAYLAHDYRLRRDKKKLERQVISNPESGSQKRSRLERFIKFIPTETDQFEQNIIQLVYGKRMSIIDLNTEEVTIIENKQLADFQKVIFQLLYKRL